MGEILSPAILKKTDCSYKSVEELLYAISLERCNNIAVTGVNGAGKSSVIETFARIAMEKENKKILRLSLSTFNIEKKTKQSAAYENDIEYKLVQQILYRSDPGDIYQTSFRRIHYRPFEKVIEIAAQIVISVACFVILFEPGPLRVESIYELYFRALGEKLGWWVNVFFDIISVGLLSFAVFRLLCFIIKRASAFSIGKVKANGLEIELSKDSSVFSKMLEELFYFFRAGKYDMVIIEDLDRLKEPAKLFLKLRELNIMLNESHVFRAERRNIRFIYAVRDDLFDSKIRVKFFDYIVPVIPIIDAYNAADYILEKYPDLICENAELKESLSEIVLPIEDMRVLKNVLNEYALYKNTIFAGREIPSASSLMAMIVYKNIWPDDYSQLHSRKSILNLLFDKPVDFVNVLKKKEIDRLNALGIEIDSIESQVRAFRKEFVDTLESRFNVNTVYRGSVPYSLQELIELDYAFEWLQKDRFTSKIETSANNQTIEFSYLQSLIDRGGAKVGKMEALRKELISKQSERGALEKEIAHKRASSYKEILSDVEGEVALDCIKSLKKDTLPEGLANFVLSMLRRGYIAANYPIYLSFSYEGTLTHRDRAFVNAVLQGSSLEYDYPLENPAAVRKMLSKEDNYDSVGALNYSFIKYLMPLQDSVLDRMATVAKSNWRFLRECDLIGGEMTNFLEKYVFEGWHECLDQIFDGDKTELAGNLQVFMHYCPEFYYLSDANKESLSLLYDVVADSLTKDTVDRVVQWLNKYRIVFKSIREPLSERESILFEAIVENGLFEISRENLLIILGEPFRSASYTSIMNCGKESLIEYLNSEIWKTVRTFPESSVAEEESAIKALLNYRSIDGEWKRAYLKRQSSEVSNLEGVETECYELVVSSDLLKANWVNVSSLISVLGSTKELNDYVVKHAAELSEQDCSLPQAEMLSLERALLSKNETLPLDVYGSFSKLFKEPLDPDAFEDDLEEARMRIIVQNNLIEFSEYGVEKLSTYSTWVVANFIINSFNRFKEIWEDLNDFDFVNNEFGIYILESTLPVEHKRWFLDKIAPSNPQRDEYYHKFSSEVCVFLNNNGLTEETDFSLAVNALVGYNEPGGDSWRVKISLINKINAVKEYNESRETRMINSLGEEYLPLNSYYGTCELEDNSENKELLQYLKSNKHYVHNFYPKGDGSLKVTFMHKPNR